MDGEPEQFNSTAKLHLSSKPTTSQPTKFTPVHKKARKHGRQVQKMAPVHEIAVFHGRERQNPKN
jgi:hypothetical protein